MYNKVIIRTLSILAVLLIPVCIHAAVGGFLVGGGVLNEVAGLVIESKINNSKAFWLLSNMTPSVVLLAISFAIILEAIIISLILKIPYILALLRMIIINIAIYALDKLFVDQVIIKLYPGGQSSEEVYYAIIAFLVVLIIRVILSTMLYMIFDISVNKKRLVIAMLCANILSSLFFVFCQIVYYYQNSSAYKSAKAFKENRAKGFSLFDMLSLGKK